MATNRVFLREILYRIDYKYLPIEDVEKIRNILVHLDFEAPIDFIGKEDNVSETIDEGKTVISTGKKNINTDLFAFHKKSHDANTEDEISIKIANTFLFLDIKLGYKSQSINYHKFFSKILSEIFKEIRLFTPVRLGIRKFNKFIICHKDIDKLSSIFNITFFNTRMFSSVENMEISNEKSIQSFGIDKDLMNFTRDTSTGFVNNATHQDEPAHLVIFDFDYMVTDFGMWRDPTEEKIKDSLVKINNYIYRSFESILNDGIKERLLGGDLFDAEGIITF